MRQQMQRHLQCSHTVVVSLKDSLQSSQHKPSRMELLKTEYPGLHKREKAPKRPVFTIRSVVAVSTCKEDFGQTDVPR